MKSILRIAAFVLFCAVPSFAQTPQIQLAAGPTFDRYTAPNGYDLDMVGWTFSGDYNVFRWLGGEFQASGDYSKKAIIGNTSVYTVQVGPQFFPLKHHRLTPWGHFLIGEGYYRDSIPQDGGFPAQVNSDFAFTWRVGAGADLNLRSHWGLRLIQFDYGPTRFFSNKTSQPDYRITIGVTYRIGTLSGKKKKK
jgi:hypothetical protein